MNWQTYLFPAISIGLNVASATTYAYYGDWNRTIYWLAAATLTTCITVR